ncbi:MAG: flagellar hook-length control protein FliK [Pseudomonadota bacterium]
MTDIVGLIAPAPALAIQSAPGASVDQSGPLSGLSADTGASDFDFGEDNSLFSALIDQALGQEPETGEDLVEELFAQRAEITTQLDVAFFEALQGRSIDTLVTPQPADAEALNALEETVSGDVTPTVGPETGLPLVPGLFASPVEGQTTVSAAPEATRNAQVPFSPADLAQPLQTRNLAGAEGDAILTGNAGSDDLFPALNDGAELQNTLVSSRGTDPGSARPVIPPALAGINGSAQAQSPAGAFTDPAIVAQRTSDQAQAAVSSVDPFFQRFTQASQSETAFVTGQGTSPAIDGLAEQLGQQTTGGQGQHQGNAQQLAALFNPAQADQARTQLQPSSQQAQSNPSFQLASSAFANETLPSLTAQISKNVAGGLDQFRIQLNPVDLGRVDVRLTNLEDGSVNARIVVERPETLDLFNRDLRALERTLQQSGLKLSPDGIDLSLADNGSSPDKGANAFNNEAGQDGGSRQGNDTAPDDGVEAPLRAADQLLVNDLDVAVGNGVVETVYARILPGQLDIHV